MKTILIVEDTISVRESIVNILKMEGYNVIEAENGEIGYELATTKNPDLILSDILMPIKDGFTLFSEIKENSNTKNIPFIFLSSKVDKSDIRTGMNLGADDYLTKPMCIEDLLTVISKKIENQNKNQKVIEDIQTEISLSIPHELKTPLNCIQVLSELLKTENSDYNPEEIRDMAGDIYNSAQHLNKLIEKYILFTGLILKKINKSDLFNKNIKQETKTIIYNISTKISLNFDRNEDLEFCLVDFKYPFNEKYFSIIIMEPVENAFKFSKPGNKVTVSSFFKNNLFYIGIENEGSSITEEQVSNIRPFSQFNRDIQEQQGVGLGLTLLKGFVELLDGRVFFETFNKNKTILIIEIPIKNELYLI